MLAGRKPVARLARQRDVVAGLAPVLADDHLECERVSVGDAPDMDNVGLLREGCWLGSPAPPQPAVFVNVTEGRAVAGCADRPCPVRAGAPTLACGTGSARVLS
jgi:hypothetical protein